ncbi:MAG: hypothetical protein ACYCXN_07855 [Acidimicrobiales bacterium]
MATRELPARDVVELEGHIFDSLFCAFPARRVFPEGFYSTSLATSVLALDVEQGAS